MKRPFNFLVGGEMKRYSLFMCDLARPLAMTMLTMASSFKKEDVKKIKTLSGREITAQEMDEYLKAQMDSLGLPGLSIAIINDARIVYHRALGVANVETKEEVTEETLFDAGSLSKTRFVYLVMRMVDKGWELQSGSRMVEMGR